MSLSQLTKGSWLQLCVLLKISLPTSILNGEEVMAKFSAIFPETLKECRKIQETTIIPKLGLMINSISMTMQGMMIGELVVCLFIGYTCFFS